MQEGSTCFADSFLHPVARELVRLRTIFMSQLLNPGPSAYAALLSDLNLHVHPATYVESQPEPQFTTSTASSHTAQAATAAAAAATSQRPVKIRLIQQHFPHFQKSTTLNKITRIPATTCIADITNATQT